jgi:hypothetical protein
VLWCGASAFLPFVAGLDTLLTAGTAQFQTALQHPMPLKSIFQLMSFFDNLNHGGYHGMHVHGAYSIWHFFFFFLFFLIYACDLVLYS